MGFQDRLTFLLLIVPYTTEHLQDWQVAVFFPSSKLPLPTPSIFASVGFVEIDLRRGVAKTC